jgi:preprotein translocase subunit SecE
MADKLKLAIAIALLIAGFVAYYVLADQPTFLRIISVLAGIALAIAVAWFTEPGRQFFAFSQESVGEAKKVVWPTRKETIQTTGIVIVLVIVMALFLWMVDSLLVFLIERFIRPPEL